MNTMKIAVKIAFMAAATIPAAASAQEAGRMLSLDEAVAVTLTEMHTPLAQWRQV